MEPPGKTTKHVKHPYCAWRHQRGKGESKKKRTPLIEIIYCCSGRNHDDGPCERLRELFEIPGNRSKDTRTFSPWYIQTFCASPSFAHVYTCVRTRYNCAEIPIYNLQKNLLTDRSQLWQVCSRDSDVFGRIRYIFTLKHYQTHW